MEEKDPMELMLEHPEREFTYHYGLGAERMSKEAAKKIDKVICELSEDIVHSIVGFSCDYKEITEKTKTLALLIDANTRAYENRVWNDQGYQPGEDLCPTQEKMTRGRKIKRVEIEINFQEPVGGLNVKKAVRNFRRQCRELMDAEIQTRYSCDGDEEPGVVEQGQKMPSKNRSSILGPNGKKSAVR